MPPRRISCCEIEILQISTIAFLSQTACAQPRFRCYKPPPSARPPIYISGLHAVGVRTPIRPASRNTSRDPSLACDLNQHHRCTALQSRARPAVLPPQAPSYMDTPAPAPRDDTGHACSRPDNLPDLSRSRTTLDSPSRPTLRKSKSLRTRPHESLAAREHHQHAVPPLPLKDDSARPSHLQSDVPPRPKMSLFSLFSKPKVEKLRGYAEPGLDAPSGPPRALSNADGRQSRQDVASRLQNINDNHGQSRPTTSRSYASKAARMIAKDSTLPPLQSERQHRSFDPPPLFQVWPQATKHGILGTTTPGPEVVLTRPKSRISTSNLFVPGSDSLTLHTPGNRSSIESRVTVKTQLRHMPSGSFAHPSLPRKLVVLVTSGYLLQYAETGSNDRLPEKILELGKDSAAYACDLIPGKHHVLQVSQTVHQKGAPAPHSHSIFSKIGLRNHATRRAASDFLLVMSNADEMDEWMQMIRKEIETQGGKRARSNSSTTRPKTGQTPKVDLQKTPSQSHRYNVVRSPHGPTAVSTPDLERFPSNLSFRAQDAVQLSGQSPSREEERPTKADSEHPKTDIEPAAPRPRAGSDAPSVSSSAGASVGHQQLERLRNSTRISHSSTAATSVTAASRTNSMTSSPSDHSKDINDGTNEYAAGRTPFRSLSSYSLLKRRSAAPLSLKDSPLPESRAPPQPPLPSKDSKVDSPVVSIHGSTKNDSTSAPKQLRLATAHSVPNLKSVDESKRDSKVAMALTTPPEERPQSFLADLPDPTSWTTRHSPSQRTPSLPFPPLFETSPVQEGNQSSNLSKTRTSPTSRPLRSGSNSFSLPLRVNTSDSHSARSPRSPRSPRYPSSEEQEGRVVSPIPAVTCLTAKVDLGTRTTIDASHIPKRTSSNANSPPRGNAGPRPSSKLSLFPGAQPPPPPQVMARVEALSSSASTTALAALVQSQAYAQKQGKLSRPASLQVRANHAPFLSNARSTTTPNMNTQSVSMAPIRALKPSRSIATMQSTQSTGPSAASDLKSNDKLAEEATDEAKPLPQRCASPAILGSVVPRPSSRNSRVPRSRSSLPHMDFGIPLSALGPPAPPPSTPLPEIPDGHNRNSIVSMRSGTPIGVAISESADEHSPQKENYHHSMGLGIKVGGGSP